MPPRGADNICEGNCIPCSCQQFPNNNTITAEQSHWKGQSMA